MIEESHAIVWNLFSATCVRELLRISCPGGCFLHGGGTIILAAREAPLSACSEAQEGQNKNSRRGGREEWMASVAISDVRKAFGATAVIHGIDVTIHDGEFVVLLGPSGCGKTTTAPDDRRPGRKSGRKIISMQAAS